MLTVSVYYLNQNAETVKAGEVRWDGKAITVSDPSSRRLDNLLTMPLHLPGGRELYPDDDPELFVRSLYLMITARTFIASEQWRNERVKILKSAFFMRRRVTFAAIELEAR